MCIRDSRAAGQRDPMVMAVDACEENLVEKGIPTKPKGHSNAKYGVTLGGNKNLLKKVNPFRPGLDPKKGTGPKTQKPKPSPGKDGPKTKRPKPVPMPEYRPKPKPGQKPPVPMPEAKPKPHRKPPVPMPEYRPK